MTEIEYSYGIIPIAKVGEGYEILLVQHRSKEGQGLHWSFPKGHKNEGESDTEAAARELEEETGLVIDSYILEESIVFGHFYRFLRAEGMVEKTNYFFPIFIEHTYDLVPQEGEIHKVRWMTIATAKQTVSFESMRELLAKIENWLQSRDH